MIKQKYTQLSQRFARLEQLNVLNVAFKQDDCLLTALVEAVLVVRREYAELKGDPGKKDDFLVYSALLHKKLAFLSKEAGYSWAPRG
ncbi:hypothetical protein Zmor_016370 [Zophobas morio]|jgi:hypothetical protein|uniref:Uncharacterized protein n=1 Tax=Zophobas morio TaxID=2755281 RepID=A0AA38HGY6_9CUCU|nr:hypothetical protein Zmor_016370 [Zophobas morio]